MTSINDNLCIKQLAFLSKNYDGENFNGTQKAADFIELISNYIFDNNLHICDGAQDFVKMVREKLIDAHKKRHKFNCEWVPIMFKKLFNEDISSY